MIGRLLLAAAILSGFIGALWLALALSSATPPSGGPTTFIIIAAALLGLRALTSIRKVRQ